MRLLAIVALAFLILTAPAFGRRPAPKVHDAHVVAFFKSHPKLARTAAGRIALLQVKVRRLGAQVRELSAAAARLAAEPRTVEEIIRSVFGDYGDQAVRVATCESGLSVWATNGQYLGLFQMGDYARGRYGHAGDAWGQARAAYAYFADSGYGWGPWECKP